MRTLLVGLVLAAGVALAASPLYAQSGGTLRLDPGGRTTGIGSRGTDRTILPPYVPVPRADPAVVDPDSQQQPAETDDGRGSQVRGDAPPPSAAEVKEDPRTTITRDRIESPQH
jgi:hypothetical protein